MKPSTVYNALKASVSLLRARKAMVRSRLVNSVLIALAGFSAVIYLLSYNSGFFAYSIAISPSSEFNDSLMLIFEQMALDNYTVFGSVGIIALFSYIVFAPIVGTATLSLVSESESSTLMLPKEHKFFDALFLNILSGVGILQLLIGTGVVSILSIEGARLQTIIFFFIIWLIAASTSTILGWVREYFTNRIGFIFTLISGIIFISILSLLITVLFIDEASNYYAIFFIAVSKLDIISFMLISILMVSILIFLVFFGVYFSSKVSHKYFAKTGAKLTNVNSLIDNSRSRFYNMILMNYLLILRTAEVRRTIAIVALIGIISILFLPVDDILVAALLVGFSATFVLSWVVNYYGLLGSGNVLIKSLYRLEKINTSALASFSFLAILFYNSIIIYLGQYFNKISQVDSFYYLLFSFVLASLFPIVALLLAAGKPYRAKLEGRGDTLLPPLVSLSYLAFFIIIAVAINNLLFAASYNVYTFVLYVLISTAILLLGTKANKHYLSLDKTQYNIMKVSNGD